jgi:hypothetical protein
MTSAVDEDAVPLATVASEAVSLLRRQLTYLKQQAKLTQGYNSELAAEARQVSNALSKLLDSSRKLVQDGADAVGSMSFQEKMALFLDWSTSLPSAYRRRLMESMMSQTPHAPAEEQDGSTTVIN